MLKKKDNRSEKYILLIIIITSILLIRYIPNCGMKYDAGMYAGIAYSLHEKGEYTYNGVKGDLPPAYPIMLAFALNFGERAIDYVTPITAILLGISAFLFFSLHGKKRYSFLLALMIIANPAIFEYSIGHFRDIPILFFTFMFYYLYEMALRKGNDPDSGSSLNKKRLSIGMGFFFALAFLSSYSAILYFLPILIHAFLNRNRFILPGLMVAAIMIFPWALWSQMNFGTPFYEHSGYLITKLEIMSALKYFSGFIIPTFVKFTPVLSFFALLGFLMEVTKNKIELRRIAKNMYFQLAIFTILPNSIWPEQTVRYIFPVLISFGYFAIRFLSSLRFGTITTAILILGVLNQGVTTVDIADYNCPRFLLLEDAGFWLRHNTNDGENVMANSFYQINYFSGKVTHQIPNSAQRTDDLIKKKNIRYIVLDFYEPIKLEPVYFNKFELVKEFEHLDDKIKIYRTRS